MSSSSDSEPTDVSDDDNNNVRRWEEEEEPRRNRNNKFKKDYMCYPIAFIEKYHLEDGNKIIMPSSALEKLMDMEIEYPMLFEIKNPDSGRVSHCGVLEFTADEGFVFMPTWMMKNMKLGEGDFINLKSVVSLPKGEYMKIQPHETKFVMNLENPKDVLEAVMKDFMCVTAGDTIMINHGGGKYYVDIVETKPSDAILLFETDCEVDFATPLDYKEPEKKPTTVIKWKNEKVEKEEEKAEKEEPKFKAFTGVARRLDGETVLKEEESLVVAEEGRHVATDESKLTLRKSDRNLGFATEKVQEKAGKEEPKFKAFTGVARRLDGETKLKEEESLRVAEERNTYTDESNVNSRKRDRNIAFGTDNDVQKPAKKVAKENVEDKSPNVEGGKCKPFIGKKYTLGG